MSKKYYAVADTFTGLYLKEPSSGFGNTKYVHQFNSKEERDHYVQNSGMLLAKNITLKVAISVFGKSRIMTHETSLKSTIDIHKDDYYLLNVYYQ